MVPLNRNELINIVYNKRDIEFQNNLHEKRNDFCQWVRCCLILREYCQIA